MSSQRVLSGMRPTGHLHLGHYHGVLKNWLKLQEEYECFFFVADWHVFTTHYAEQMPLKQHVMDMVVDWLAVGLNPNLATLFVQSKVPEHAKLHLLLSMITPLNWLERVPSYKDQQKKLATKDLSTYGFLGYPLLQSADILAYKPSFVPVGEDQVAHIELTREIARRFNFIYGREPDFEQKADQAIKKLSQKNAEMYQDCRRRFQQQGDTEALSKAQALLKEQQNITLADRDRLTGYLEGGGRIVLAEPESLLTPISRMPGLDGQKMSKSYNNTIALRHSNEQVSQNIKTMPTDPARVKITDKGDPENCPVWPFHNIYSNEEEKNWVSNGCRQARIGCLECKKTVIDNINTAMAPIKERITEYQNKPQMIEQILFDGSERARDVAKDTLAQVSEAMGINY